MDKIDIYIKSTIVFIGSLFSYFVDGFGWAVTVLCILMLADFVTGLLAGAKNEGLSSRRGYKGIKKKVYTIILIGTVHLLERYIIGSNGILGDGAAIAFIVIEFVSIVENGGRMGIRMPIQISKVIEVLKGDVKNDK